MTELSHLIGSGPHLSWEPMSLHGLILFAYGIAALGLLDRPARRGGGVGPSDVDEAPRVG